VTPLHLESNDPRSRMARTVSCAIELVNG
jgi:hypothetical protein